MLVWAIILFWSSSNYALYGQLSDEEVSARIAFYDGITQKLLRNKSEALMYFERAVALNPKLDAGWYNVGDVLVSMGRVASALAPAKKAFSLDPENYWYGMMVLRIESDMGRTKDALVTAKLMAKEFPYPSVFFVLAEKQEAAGKWKESLRILDKLQNMGVEVETIDEQRLSIYSRNLRGRTLERALQKEIRVSASKDIYWLALSEMYHRQGRFSLALSTLKELEEWNPQHPRVHLIMSHVYRALNQPGEAMSAIIKAFENPEADPENKIQVLGYLVQQALSDSQWRSDAFKLTLILLKMFPNDANVHQMYGDLLMEEGKKSEALLSYLKVLSLGGRSFEMYRQLMLLSSELYDYNQLISIAKEATELYPNHPIPFIFLGEGYLRKQEYSLAQSAFLDGSTQLVSSDQPNYLSCQLGLAESYAGLLEFEEAEKIYEKLQGDMYKRSRVDHAYARYLCMYRNDCEKTLDLLSGIPEIQKSNSEVLFTLGLAQFKLLRHEEAITTLERCLKSGGNRFEMFLLLGEVKYAIGDKMGAHKIWNESLNLPNSNRYLIDQKLNLP